MFSLLLLLLVIRILFIFCDDFRSGFESRLLKYILFLLHGCYIWWLNHDAWQWELTSQIQSPRVWCLVQSLCTPQFEVRCFASSEVGSTASIRYFIMHFISKNLVQFKWHICSPSLRPESYWNFIGVLIWGDRVSHSCLWLLGYDNFIVSGKF